MLFRKVDVYYRIFNIVHVSQKILLLSHWYFNVFKKFVCNLYWLARMSTDRYLFEEEKFNFEKNPHIDI